MQASVMVVLLPAVTTTDVGCEHGSSRLWPPSTSMMSGDRPETWYRPGGSGTENSPEDPTVTVTAWRPAAVKVTVPDMGRSPGCWPPGPSGPPSMTSFPGQMTRSRVYRSFGRGAPGRHASQQQPRQRAGADPQ